MPAYKPSTKNTCSGLFANKENESGFQYFCEKSGEETIMIFAAEIIQLPGTMKVLNENLLNWVKAGNVMPTVTSRENITLMQELDIDQSKLVGVSISSELKEISRGKFIRKIKSTQHKRDLYILDEHCQLMQKAIVDNNDLELFATKDKRAGFYLIGSNERIYAYIQEYMKEQTELPLDDMVKAESEE